MCEIGTKLHATGTIVQAKVLGGYAMIDEGEMDWKFITIDVTDEHADKLNGTWQQMRHICSKMSFMHEYS